MIIKSIHSKAIALFLGIVFFLTNTAFAYAPQLTVWDERKQASELRTKRARVQPPSGLSTEQHSPRILDAPTSTLGIEAFGDHTVVLIKDIHMNHEAQKNIASMLTQLIQVNHMELVALEGAFEPLNLSPFISYPDQKSVRLVADHLLKENQISGPVYALMTAGREIPTVTGIDDPRGYKANVAAYLDSINRKDEISQLLTELNQTLNLAKLAEFDGPLAHFDFEVERYRTAETSMLQYIQAIAPHSQPVPPSIKTLLSHLENEMRLNKQAVKRELSEVFHTLIEKTSEFEADKILNLSVTLTDNRLPQAAFTRELQKLCRAANVDLNAMPALQAYIEFVVETDQLDYEAIAREAQMMETRGYERLASNEKQRNIVQWSRYHHLLGKLAGFSLTRDEWEDYKSISAGLNWTHMPRPDLRTFERFYIEATGRDQALAKNFLLEMDRHGARSAALVAGGFHHAGIKKELEKHGFTVLSLSPRLTNLDVSPSSSLLGFLKEKSPLERFFSNLGHALSQHPATAATLTSGGAQTIVTHVLFSPIPIPAVTVQNEFITFSNTGILSTHKTAGNVEAAIRHPNSPNTVYFNVSPAPNGEIQVKQWLEPVSRAPGRFGSASASAMKMILALAFLPALLPSAWAESPVGTIFRVPEPSPGIFIPVLATMGVVVLIRMAYLFIASKHSWNFTHPRFSTLAGIFTAFVLSTLPLKAPVVYTQIQLAWDPSTDNVAGYRIYVGRESRKYDWHVDVGDMTSAFINVNSGIMNYMTATAYNEKGRESHFSNEVTWGPPSLNVRVQKDLRGYHYYTMTYSGVRGESYIIESSVDMVNWVKAPVVVTSRSSIPNQNHMEGITVKIITPPNDPVRFFRIGLDGGMIPWVKDILLPKLGIHLSTAEYRWASSFVENGLAYLVVGVGFLGLNLIPGLPAWLFEFSNFNAAVWIAFIVAHTNVVARWFHSTTPSGNLKMAGIIGAFNILIGLTVPSASAVIVLSILIHWMINYRSEIGELGLRPAVSDGPISGSSVMPLSAPILSSVRGRGPSAPRIVWDTRSERNISALHVRRLAQEARETGIPTLVMPFLNGTTDHILRSVKELAKSYLMTDGNRIQIQAVVENVEAEAAISRWIKDSQQTRVHVQVRKPGETLAQIQSKSLELGHVHNDLLEQGRLQIFISQGISLGDNFMHGILPDQLSRSRIFALWQADAINFLAIEVPSMQLHEMQKFIAIVLSQA